MTIHTLNLRRIPFDKIKTGTKIVESRLFDEKRQLIHVGDHIVFECTEDTSFERIEMRVVELLRATSFEVLFKMIPLAWIGHTELETALTEVHQFYSLEQQEKYGVVGIKLTPKRHKV